MASPLSLFRKIKRWLIGNPFKKLWSYIKRLGRKRVISIILTYFGTTLASTYLLTGLFTPANLLNPPQVISVIEKTGIINTLTFGLEAPVVNGLKSNIGDLANGLGKLINNPDMAKWGSSLKSEGDAFFKEGLGTFTPDGKTLLDDNSSDFFNIGSFLGFSNSGDNYENPSINDTDALVEPVNNSDNQTISSPETVNGKRWTTWDGHLYPNYYRIIDEPVEIDESVKAGNIRYYGFDDLGRTQRAIANVTYAMVEESSGWRAGFKSDVNGLSGWGKNFKAEIALYNGETYNGWFWNRSHLIADSLGGYDHVYDSYGQLDQNQSKSERRNLITGTRMQNVGTNNVHNSGYGGMAYFERMVVDYIESHPTCSVWYSAEPIYEGDELIPRSVIVKVKSCDGGINVQGEVFNACAGYEINYYTGEAYPKQ